MSEAGALLVGLAVLDEQHGVLSFTASLPRLLGISDVTPGSRAAALLAASPNLGAAERERAAAWIAGLCRDAPAETTLHGEGGQILTLRADPLRPAGWSLTVTGTVLAEPACPRPGLPDAILAALPQAVCVFDADDRVTRVNPAWDTVMDGCPIRIGETRGEIGRRMAFAGELGPGDPETLIAEVIEADLSRPQRLVVRRPTGRVVEMYAHPLPEGGRILVIGDITPLAEAEAAAEQRAAQIDVMLTHTRHAVLYWGPDRRLIASNRLATELLGHPPGLLVPGRAEDEVLDHMLAREEWG
ncbi:MAG: PAS-domain containing protein, partial [Rhodospirillales bacterium]|nr:PAS-domain containing protein [Rhodospirillales bacterium]